MKVNQATTFYLLKQQGKSVQPGISATPTSTSFTALPAPPTIIMHAYSAKALEGIENQAFIVNQQNPINWENYL